MYFIDISLQALKCLLLNNKTKCTINDIFQLQTFFLPEKFLMYIYCKQGGVIYHQPPSITCIVLGALLGTENLSFIFSFWRWCICMSELPRLQIMFFYISGKFNFISDSITNFYLGLAAQWVIDNFLYFCCTVLKYL